MPDAALASPPATIPVAPSQPEAAPNGLAPSLVREGRGVLTVLKDFPASTLTLLGLLGVVGALVYGVVWVHPQTQREMQNEWIRSNEDQQEMNRSMYREERAKAREQTKRLEDGIGRLEKAIEKWELRKP